MQDMDRSFTTWNRQIRTQLKKEQCHYHANMEFLSLYSLQVNRASSAMLRLNENEDILRQMSHLTRKTLISFAYLPRLLTMELKVVPEANLTISDCVNFLRPGRSHLNETVCQVSSPGRYAFPRYKREEFCCYGPLCIHKLEVKRSKLASGTTLTYA